jgi:hypothetical protein
VTQLATGSVDLAYQLSFSGTDSIEPYTGSTLDVREVTETLTARPTGDAVTTLQAVLERYPDNTEAKAGLGAITSLAANPINVFTNAYSQTDSSVRDISRTVKDQRDKRRLAERTIRDLALIVGLVLIVVGVLLLVVRGRRKLPPAPARTIDDTAGDPA